MSAFEDCYIDKNYRALIIGEDDNTIEDYQLLNAWLDIQEQWSVAIGDSEQQMYVKLQIEVNNMSGKLAGAKALLEIFPFFYANALGKMVNKFLGTSIVFNATDRVEFARQIKSCENRLPGIEMKIELKKLQIQEIENKWKKKTDTGAVMSHSYFSTWYNVMEEHFKVPIDPARCTVERFCERAKRMSKHFKSRKTR